MKNKIKEIVICTVVPTIIPIIWLIPQEYVNDDARSIFMSICYIVDLVLIIIHYYKACKEDRKQLETKIKSTAYTNAFQCSGPAKIAN